MPKFALQYFIPDINDSGEGEWKYCSEMYCESYGQYRLHENYLSLGTSRLPRTLYDSIEATEKDVAFIRSTGHPFAMRVVEIQIDFTVVKDLGGDRVRPPFVPPVE